MRKHKWVIYLGIGMVGIGLLFAGYWFIRTVLITSGRTARVIRFIRNPDKFSDWIQTEKVRCGDAPFIMPTTGFIGFLWQDSFRPFHYHQGLDIFGGTEPGITPVYAVAVGFLTRQSDWKSSVVLRLPEDPIHPGEQVWVYYTHMADPDGNSTILPIFPPASQEIPVKQGDLLGYQGNFSGNPGNPVGVHLHISILKDDGKGRYTNELFLKNTHDPSPYFGLPLNALNNLTMPVRCIQTNP
jgi:murein DD-endopeptidase MepM/ murein hydrolase activator NlpD